MLTLFLASLHQLCKLRHLLISSQSECAWQVNKTAAEATLDDDSDAGSLSSDGDSDAPLPGEIDEEDSDAVDGSDDDELVSGSEMEDPDLDLLREDADDNADSDGDADGSEASSDAGDDNKLVQGDPHLHEKQQPQAEEDDGDPDSSDDSGDSDSDALETEQLTARKESHRVGA